ncbi:ATP-binding protein [Massilia soli]|uniref:histidine kinase n=1 Tax=Massilia soli TaxID=2792854 RepID=A0ABS7SMT9_9BURK|nr:sensor histidine kinase [Massilia soli]MBZ2207489.1 sensor histidine kinase [Massilia soli]
MSAQLANTAHLILAIAVRSELDVIASRQRARQIAEICGFVAQDQARIGTAVSELARDVFGVAAAGQVSFSLSSTGMGQALLIVIEDTGPAEVDLQQLLGGHADQRLNNSNGMHAARRFMDRCDSRASGNGCGSNIILTKFLPQRDAPLGLAELSAAVSQFSSLPSNVALSEATYQNKELADALSALQEKQEELLELSRQLSERNDEVVILNGRLKQKAESLLSADRRKDEFLSMLSHELRGPLSATTMAVDILKRPPYSAEQTERMSQLIGRQAGHMSQLVEDLLDVSRISRGLVSIDKSPIDLRDVVAAAVEQVGPAMAAKRHQVTISVSDTPCIVHGDRTRMLQVVSNLLGNAVRYTLAEGVIRLALDVRGNSVALTVTDNGIGLVPESIATLFDLYVQAESSSHGPSGGLGLGLALVKSLVEIHKGSVTASSAGLGHGSTFEVILPRVADAA